MSDKNAKSITKNLFITDIRTDGGTQPRAEIDQKTVAEYADELKSGAKLPPVVVFDDGATKWLADGFHRWHGHNKAGKKTVPSEIHSGTLRDAVLYSVGANATHGLRRTNADKRKAVETLLNDAEWSQRSANWIAKKCGVSDQFVLNLKGEQVPTVGTSSSTVTGQDGKQYPASQSAQSDNSDTASKALSDEAATITTMKSALR